MKDMLEERLAGHPSAIVWPERLGTFRTSDLYSRLVSCPLNLLAEAA